MEDKIKNDIDNALTKSIIVEIILKPIDSSTLVHVKVENNKIIAFLDEFDVLDIFVTPEQVLEIREYYFNTYELVPFIKPQEELDIVRNEDQSFKQNVPGFISFNINELNKAIKEKKFDLYVDERQELYF